MKSATKKWNRGMEQKENCTQMVGAHSRPIFFFFFEIERLFISGFNVYRNW